VTTTKGGISGKVTPDIITTNKKIQNTSVQSDVFFWIINFDIEHV